MRQAVGRRHGQRSQEFVLVGQDFALFPVFPAICRCVMARCQHEDARQGGEADCVPRMLHSRSLCNSVAKVLLFLETPRRFPPSSALFVAICRKKSLHLLREMGKGRIFASD